MWSDLSAQLRRSKKNKTCLASGLCGKKEGGGVFFLLVLSKWPPDTFSKTTGRPIFSRWLPVFCFNGPHLDSGYDIRLFTAGFGKRSYFSFNSLKKRKEKRRRPQKRKRAGTLNMFVFLLRLSGTYRSPLVQQGRVVSYRNERWALIPHWALTVFVWFQSIRVSNWKCIVLCGTVIRLHEISVTLNELVSKVIF